MSNVMVLEVSAGAWGLAVIVISLLEGIKKTKKVPSNYIAITSVVLGGVLGFAYGLFTELTVVSGIVSGVTVGVFSCGLYSVVGKKLLEVVGLGK